MFVNAVHGSSVWCKSVPRRRHGDGLQCVDGHPRCGSPLIDGTFGRHCGGCSLLYRLEETVHSLMPYRNQAEVLEKRLSQLCRSMDVSINHCRHKYHTEHCAKCATYIPLLPLPRRLCFTRRLSVCLSVFLCVCLSVSNFT